jgi:hypothetical protein
MTIRTEIKTALRNACIAIALFTILLALPSYAQFTPSDDAYVNSASASTNFGTAGTLGVVSPSQTSYIRFDLTAVPSTYTGAQVAKATLKLFVNGVTTAGNFNIDVVAGSWSEKTITYNLQPAIGSTIASAVPLTTANKSSYIEVDITSTVQSWLNGTEPNDGIVLVPNSPLNATFTTKENTGTSHPPELDIVFYGSGAQGPAGPTGPQGSQGPQGSTGPAGPIGPVGPVGPTGPVGVVNRGTWSPSTQYQDNDTVSYDGSSWIALLPNLDSAPNATNPAWQLLAAKGINNQGSWVQSINYQVDDAVTEGGQFWLAIAPNIASQPNVLNPNWQLISASGAAGPAGPAGPQGAAGSTGATGPAGPAGPQGVQGATGSQGPVGPMGLTGPQGAQGTQGTQGPPPTFAGTWSNATKYSLGTAVFYSGSSYISLSNGNIGVQPGTDPTQWALLAQQGATGATGATGPQGPQGPQGPGGAGTINAVFAGTALTGGGTTGNVTLNLDTTKVPQLAAGNAFTAAQNISSNSSFESLFVTNTGTGHGIVAFANGGFEYGLFGTNNATNGYGVGGASSGGVGVLGSDSSGGIGVSGTSSGTGVGVSGANTSSGYGVLGQAKGSTGQGVWGESFGTGFSNGAGSDGVHGVSHSTAGSGVAGINDAQDATGVYGSDTSGYGFVTDSHTSQARNKGGWLKAMVYIKFNGSSFVVVRCFNSQLQGSAASTTPCGITVSPYSTDALIVDFGFEVDDRFVQVSFTGTGSSQGYSLSSDGNGAITSNQVYVAQDGVSTIFPFYVLVY